MPDHRAVGEDRTGADRRRLTVPQAAEALGVTVDAVRGRIRRGKLEAEHDSGAVYVWIDAPEENDGPQQSATSQRPSADQAERIEELREQVAYLREQLAQANERDRENRRIIAALTSRIPAIEAPAETPSEASEAIEAVEEQQGRGEPHSATVESQESVQRPWWRKVFGR
jgi:septal ring factor EnvC (AmiA/AmiB activator)